MTPKGKVIFNISTDNIADTIEENYKIYGYGSRESLIKALKSNVHVLSVSATKV